MEGPRAPREAEMGSCLDLVNRVFRRDRAPTMAEEFPLLFADANRERLRVMVEEGRVVCHVGVLYQAIHVGPSVIPVACIGAVCTDPEARGRRLASRALESAMDMMHRDGRPLMLVSGNRGLYARQECVTAGKRFTFRLRKPADGMERRVLSPDRPVSVRPRREDDVPGLAALHDAEAVRYQRGPEMWRSLLPAFERHGSTVVMIEREDRGAVAYLVIRHGGPMAWDGPAVGRVLEYAGDRDAVLAALAPAAGLVGVPELRISVTADQAATAARLVEAGLTPEEGPLPGTLHVRDPAGLVARLVPWWRERMGSAASVQAVTEGGRITGVVVQDGVGRPAAEVSDTAFLPLADAPALARLLFSGEAPAGIMGPLAAAVPVPLPEPGLNYV